MTKELDEIRRIMALRNCGSTLSRNKELVAFLKEQTPFLPNTCKITERAYVVLHPEDSRICPNGQQKTFRYFTTGYGYCGTANECACFHEFMSENISKLKNAYSDEKQAKITEKRKETSRRVYGYDTPTESPEIKEQIKQANLAKYGVVSTAMIPEVKARQTATLQKNYGVSSPMKSQIIKNRAMATHLARYGRIGIFGTNEFKQVMFDLYGYAHALQSPDLHAKRDQTCLDRHGDIHPSRLQEFREKAKETCQERYGVDHGSQKLEFHETRLKTMVERYGYENPSQIHLGSEVLDFWFDYSRFHTKYQELGFYGMLDRFPTIHQFILLKRMRKYGIPTEEFETTYETELFIERILDRLGVSYQTNTRMIIKPLELDFYVDDQKLAIEVGGLYWHSEAVRPDTKYHRKKWEMCQAKGIKLVTIFSDELEQKPMIVIDRLVHLLRKSPRVATARQCEIREISSKECRTFVDEHHIQGHVNSSIKLGAWFDDQLVAVMTFGKLRRSLGQVSRTDGSYELLRFCSVGNVVGIASKLWHHFLRKYTPTYVISYCDLRWSDGHLYEVLGFRLDGLTSPNYWYTHDFTVREHRFKYRKDVLVREGFDPSMTEKQIMIERGYERIWDCGHKRYIWSEVAILNDRAC